MAQRQTASYLRKRFHEIGLFPNARHGQNFLIDYNLVELLARTAELSDQDVVLEVGTGTGALTVLMAKQAAAVVTVEIDRHLHQLAREELRGCDNVTMLLQDALKNKNRIHDNVIDGVRSVMRERQVNHFKLAANLPYSIATPMISNLLRREPVPQSMTITIQKELADRIMATPSTKDYSSLSVWVQSLCQIQRVRDLPPTVFWPRPKVHSAIIKIVPRPDLRNNFTDLEFFHKFVRSLFLHRRKFLRSVLISAFKGQLQKGDVDRIMEQRALGAKARAEALSVAAIQQLAESFRQVACPPQAQA